MNLSVKTIGLSELEEIFKQMGGELFGYLISRQLYQITRTCQIDYYRKEKCEARMRAETARENFESGETFSSADEIIFLFETGLNDPGLTQRQTESLRLYLLEGLSCRNIARILKVSYYAVRRDLKEGRSILMAYFKKEGITPGEF